MRTTTRCQAGLLFATLLNLTACSGSSSDHATASMIPQHASAQAWYQAGAERVTQAKNVAAAINNTRGAAKNVVLFVGDGMGVSTVTAARILAGQRRGNFGEEHNLSFDKFPFSGLAKTYNTNQQTPDSAGTMTAIITGVKTKAGVVGVSETVVRGDCASSRGLELTSALELAEVAGKATGIISTTRITHATPAATYAKSAERSWEDNTDMPAAALAAGCRDIADQLIHFESLLEARVNQGADHPNIDGIDVVMGGGRRHFLPNNSADNSGAAPRTVAGNRTDGRNLITEWQTLYPEGIYRTDQAGFDAIDPASTTRVLGLFNASHMRYEADRNNGRNNDTRGEPSLTAMTAKSIDILDNNAQGFFLMVEGGRIDHGHHAGSAYNALSDAVEFARAVQTAVDNTNPAETLIIVTADHSHVLTIAGYPTRGNPILGKVTGNDRRGEAHSHPARANDGLPYTTLGYANGQGFKAPDTNAPRAVTAGRADLTRVDSTRSGFHQEALVPTASETHGGEDVAIYATGPGSHLVTGTLEQNVLFHIMNYAADLAGKAGAAL